MYDRVIKGGTIVTTGGVFESDLAIMGSRIAAIGFNLEGSEEVDARGLLVLPGGVDPHVHLEMPTAVTRTSEDWASGTLAAAYGGTTTVIDFVEPEGEQSLIEAFEQRNSQALGRASIDYSLHMTLTAADEDTLAQIPLVTKAGITSFKLYTTYVGFALTDRDLLRALTGIRQAGGIALVHCENDAIVEDSTAGLLENGYTHPRFHPQSRPVQAEVEAIQRVISLAGSARTPVYIVHISTTGGMKAVDSARNKGETVFGETCPQYLLLNDTQINVDDPYCAASFICAPPLRIPEYNDRLWHGLNRGILQSIGTDHCAFNIVGQKDMGLYRFTKVPGGLPGIETRLSLIYSFGVYTGRLTLEQWVAACSANPARIFGLWPRKGSLLPGADADIVLFDPEKQVTLSKSFLHEQVDYTPYEGMQCKGWPVATYVNGKLLIYEGQQVDTGKSGRFLPRLTGPVAL